MNVGGHMTAVLSLKNVSFQVGEKVLIDRVSFDVQEGSCLCIVGPSGSGKSTLIRLFNRLNVKTSGDIFYRDHPIEFYPVSELRHRIAMVFQRTSVFPGSVADNLKMALQFRSKEKVADDDPRFVSALNHSGLASSYLSENAELLSGGEQQRIAIARTMLRNAPILVLDEATAFADPENEENDLKERLTEMAKQSVAFTTMVTVPVLDYLVQPEIVQK